MKLGNKQKIVLLKAKRPIGVTFNEIATLYGEHEGSEYPKTKQIVATLTEYGLLFIVHSTYPVTYKFCNTYDMELDLTIE